MLPSLTTMLQVSLSWWRRVSSGAQPLVAWHPEGVAPVVEELVYHLEVPFK